MSKPIIFDLDDYCDEWNVLPKLLDLKKILPGLKVNLFTIPLKISFELFNETTKHDWIQMIPHGFRHSSNFECARMSKYEAEELFDCAMVGLMVPGFKAPGWQISTDVMEALRDRDYWLAVQYSDGRLEGHPDGPYQPQIIPGLNYFALNETGDCEIIHGHTHDVCGNGLDALWPRLINLSEDSVFVFIDDYVRKEIRHAKK